MHRLDDYISAKYGAKYVRSIPKIVKELGALDISIRKPGFYGVSGNTFRAYQGWDNQPSVIFNGWAKRIVESIDPQNLSKQIKEREGFLEWHDSLFSSLERRWRYYEGSTPDLAHKLKMIDLFIKWLSAHNLGNPKIITALVRHANCALDSQTLDMMNKCYSNALPLGKTSMGNIKTIQSYLLCQDLIDRFSRRFGGTRLLFDYYAYKRGAVNQL